MRNKSSLYSWRKTGHFWAAGSQISCCYVNTPPPPTHHHSNQVVQVKTDDPTYTVPLNQEKVYLL